MATFSVVAPASAQSIAGRVLEQVGQRPIGLVEVTLHNADGVRLIATESDWDGRFRFGPLAAGLYTLRAARIGYADASVQVDVTLDAVSDVVLELSPEAVAIEGVEVNVRRGPDIQHTATYQGLYTRRGEKRWANLAGPNRVFVRSDLEPMSGMILKNFISVHRPPGLGFGGLLGNSLRAPNNHEKLASRGCQPQFLERGGLPMTKGMVERVLELPISEFEGIEMFGVTHEAPAGIRPVPARPECGIVVLWPRRKPGER
ncbi:MAG TPA: carboxypeptidase-like regulatory domain-containing protein [Longimicrobiales bacterium]|nr:carboxypeptidase-like regulatory domain-containing protein [Longimicrobiales bacterium]